MSGMAWRGGVKRSLAVPLMDGREVAEKQNRMPPSGGGGGNRKTELKSGSPEELGGAQASTKLRAQGMVGGGDGGSRGREHSEWFKVLKQTNKPYAEKQTLEKSNKLFRKTEAEMAQNHI